jgi:Helix-turn-helix domain
MHGERLHDFDLRLCRHVLDNVGGYLDRPAFAAYAERRLDPSVWKYLKALDADDAPQPLLLSEEELDDLALTFACGPWKFDRPWVPHEPLHKRSIECVKEIRDALAAGYAEEWARASARFAETLERGRTWLGGGIRVVQEWVGEARRYLRAMGAVDLLPAPEGSFPTPTCPAPPPTVRPSVRQDNQSDDSWKAAIAEVQTLQREVRDLLLSQRTVKDFYTTAEVATLLGKAEFTVREWCRNGRVRAQKQGSGRGKHQAWVIAHGELQRLQREGLLPVQHQG